MSNATEAFPGADLSSKRWEKLHTWSSIWIAPDGSPCCTPRCLEALRGRGIAGTLAKTGLEYARDNNLKVDVVCPLVANYLSKHPEFQALVGQ